MHNQFCSTFSAPSKCVSCTLSLCVSTKVDFGRASTQNCRSSPSDDHLTRQFAIRRRLLAHKPTRKLLTSFGLYRYEIGTCSTPERVAPFCNPSGGRMLELTLVCGGPCPHVEGLPTPSWESATSPLGGGVPWWLKKGEPHEAGN
jgi:hypothetical protein